MVADGLLTRQRYREVPPRVDYELTERARELMPVLGALARWGYDWAWSAPRPGEDVDVGAIFRLAPGLLEPPPVSGAVELVSIADGERARAPLRAHGRATASVEIAERERRERRRPRAAAATRVGRGPRPRGATSSELESRATAASPTALLERRLAARPRRRSAAAPPSAATCRP